MPKTTVKPTIKKTVKKTATKARKSQVKKTKGTKTLLELKKELINIRLKIKVGQEKNTNAHKDLKKQIAQLLTKQNQE